MMKTSRLIVLIVLAVFWAIPGCENKENVEFTDWPIIEAYLSPGDCFGLTVSRQVPFIDDVEYSGDDIDNLDISLIFEEDTLLLDPAGEGVYTDSSLTVKEGDEYTIMFQFNGKPVFAYTYIPVKPENMEQSATKISIERMDSNWTPVGGGGMSMPDPIEITWDNDDDSYYLMVIENIEDSLDPIRDFGDEDPPENIFRKQPNTSTSEEIRSNDFTYYGTHRVVLFHVLPDYADLYDENSNSSQNLTNPSTSIANGYGIFTGLNSDTVFIEVKEAK